MTAAKSPERPPRLLFTQRLGFRLGLVLSVAILPIGILAVQRSSDLLKVAQAKSEIALTGETLRAVAPEVEALRRGQGIADSIGAAMLTLKQDVASCSKTLRDIVSGSNNAVSFMGYTEADGIMRCSSAGKELDFRGSERLAKLMSEARPTLAILRQASVSKQPVLSYTIPVRREDGSVDGILSLSMPHESLVKATRDLQPADVPDPLSLITFDNEGTILTASVGLANAGTMLPAGVPLVSLASDDAKTFTARAESGRYRTFSVVPLASGQLYALGTWPVSQSSVDGRFAALGPMLFPALMWIAGLAAAWAAAEILVLRYIRSLRLSMVSFAGGKRSVGALDYRGAPREIREVAESYLSMTDTVLHDEAELEDMVHQKEVLLREVHHRVKNNLQLIASIMNMQMRKAESPEARLLMQGLQERVMSLATIHRGLYQTSGLTDIRADELLQDIVRQIVKIGSGPGRTFDVQTSFADIRLTPDQAVPLGLFLTEAMTNAMKYAGGGDGHPTLRISFLRIDPMRVELCVENSVSARDASAAVLEVKGTGLGSQLFQAFASQLGAKLKIGVENGVHVVRLGFDTRPLNEAEERAMRDDLEPQ